MAEIVFWFWAALSIFSGSLLLFCAMDLNYLWTTESLERWDGSIPAHALKPILQLAKQGFPIWYHGRVESVENDPVLYVIDPESHSRYDLAIW